MIGIQMEHTTSFGEFTTNFGELTQAHQKHSKVSIDSFYYTSHSLLPPLPSLPFPPSLPPHQLSNNKPSNPAKLLLACTAHLKCHWRVHHIRIRTWAPDTLMGTSINYTMFMALAMPPFTLLLKIPFDHRVIRIRHHVACSSLRAPTVVARPRFILPCAVVLIPKELSDTTIRWLNSYGQDWSTLGTGHRTDESDPIALRLWCAHCQRSQAGSPRKRNRFLQDCQCTAGWQMSSILEKINKV